jgi:two-component system, NtrC family, sensor kinase
MATTTFEDLTPGTEARLFEALASLNQIGASINRLGSGNNVILADVLRLIADSAIKVVPGSAAVIYAYDESTGIFDLDSRVSSGDWMPQVLGDGPRPNGLGMRAIQQRRRVLSYQEPGVKIHPLKYNAGARAVACCPMVVADQAVGVLYLYLNEKRKFRQMELLLLDNFVNQTAMAIDQTRRISNVRRDLARKEDELNRLRRAGLLISSRLKLDETLDAILQMALEVTGAQYGIFRLVDKNNQNLVTRALAGEHLSRPQIEALPLDSNSVMAWVARNRQPVCIPDLQQEPWAQTYYPLDAELKMRSELAVPLVGASGRLEGVLNLESPAVHAFSEQDSHLLQALATQAVIAIQEARLLDALQEVAELLLSQPYDRVLDRLVELSRDLLNAVSSSIWILEGDQLVLKAAYPGQDHSQSLPLYHSLAGQAVISRGPVAVNDASTDERFHRVDLAKSQGWTRVLVVPLLSSGKSEPVGAFSVYGSTISSTNFTESDWDKKVLNSLAQYAALAVHNANHQAALRSAQEQRSVAETFAAVGDIAANLLHQLNNKVGAIPVRVQGIQAKCSPVLDQEKYLASNLVEIEKSAREAMDVVRDNLSYLNPIHLSQVKVADCVRAAISEADLPPTVQVETENLDNLPDVNAAQRGLVMVFVNLIQNAVEAMKGEGLVSVRGKVRSGWVEIAVSDNGPGISPELHHKIFELAFSDRPEKGAGKLGFGLWWVKTWMARLGGSVHVSSDGQQGTTFWLRLPHANES